MDGWKEKMKAAHDMVRALCQPRGSEGSRRWVMSIPAKEDYDPDLVITSGLMAAEKEIDALTAERDRLVAENAELEYWKQGNIRCASQLATANATLDRLREVVPECWYWCADCEKMTPPDEEDPGFCGVCESDDYWHRGMHVAIKTILYPKETEHGN